MASEPKPPAAAPPALANSERAHSERADSERASQPAQAPDFEQALAELETLVERLERGDLPLEEALRTFERGVTLTRHCQSALKAAQQKVEILLKRNGALGVEPFATGDDGPSSGEDDAD